MDPVTIGLFALAAVLILLILRTPIAVALGVVATVGIFLIFAWRPYMPFNPDAAWRPTFSLLANSPYAFITSYTLSTVPLFIFMGHLAYQAGFTTDIYHAARVWLTRVPGGVAMASVVGCGGFSAITGSSVACAAAMGRIAIPEMLRFGYDKALASGSVAIGGTLGSLIPPSILFILFGIFAEESIAELFIAAVIPGLLSLLGYVVVIFIWAKLKPAHAPTPEEDLTRAVRLDALKRCWAILVLFAVVIGGIYLGVFTPTEAAGVGAIACLALGLVLRRLNGAGIVAALKESAFQTSMIFAIAIGGKLFVNFMALTGIPAYLIDVISASDVEMWMVMGLIVLLYIGLGMFLDPIGIILLTLPLTLPIVETYGLSFIWFGVIVVKLLEIGLVTPPIGLNVFVIKSIVEKQVSLEAIFKGVSLFLAADAIVLGLLLGFPALSLWLPSLMG
ncbi:MAG: TRAP transporter large permease [Marivibrio sp.]|uniref:TRAP transporter large permease n=1 Tax=Marivibrio sp. TaxID=2039719 RepID=UPI0032EC7D50